MTDNIVEMPRQQTPEFIIGPFTEYRVVIDGRAIPRVTGRRVADGKVELVVDHRFGATFDEGAAYQAAWLIANAMAVGAGYPHFGAESKEQPFAPRVMQLGDVPKGER